MTSFSKITLLRHQPRKKPKPVPNPIKDSNLHSALNRELKIKSKSGSVLPQKTELEKAFHNRRVGKIQSKNQIPDDRTEIEIELSARLQRKKFSKKKNFKFFSEFFFFKIHFQSKKQNSSRKILPQNLSMSRFNTNL